ncbi:succinate CoA transferase [Salinisphaera sp.]|uniref:succinate CoA transferase n=1 Tax=Salinisphaera sp. TaxID=1914330 RepID=UPI002D7679BA|nr:succinate CoA transferase [Salinisphaera sp.]HET7314653.1 succinate CoA transferase [Salinisphaera sp.]
MTDQRCRLPGWQDRQMTAQEAAELIQDGMTVGMSGFTLAGEAKEVPVALAQRAADEPLSITLMTGASLGNDIDARLTDAGVIARRLPFQVDATLRQAINEGRVMFIDEHLSEIVERQRHGDLGPMDVAIIEACAITEEGGIVPTTSVGNSATFAHLADKVIVELNQASPEGLEGLHDIYIPGTRPKRQPIPIVQAASRIGDHAIPVDIDKIAAIVLTEGEETPAEIKAPDEATQQIVAHVKDFLEAEVEAGRLTSSLLPLQAGLGSMANAALWGIAEGPFDHLQMYSEVLQDSAFDLLDSGQMTFASATSITLSEERGQQVMDNLAAYHDRVVLRPQELTNHPEIIRRLGVIAINTALEADIYGNVNSSHMGGTQLVNAIGGSGDFARNAHLSIFVTKSLAKDGDVSAFVPFVSHVDHTEHDVDVLVSEHGLADLRGLAPRERAREIIDRCADPLYRDALNDYFNEACKKGGQTPHCLDKAFAWHTALETEGSMRSVSGSAGTGT